MNSISEEIMAEEMNRRGLEELVIGQLVHYVMPNGKHRPAFVVEKWDKKGLVNLMVVLDGLNDKDQMNSNGLASCTGLQWETSVPFSTEQEPHSWHWAWDPDKVFKQKI